MQSARAILCFRLWLVRLYGIPQVILQKAGFSKNLIEHKSVFWFYIQRLSETFLILKKLASYYRNRTFYSSRILMELALSGHIFEKLSNIEFHENPCIGGCVVPCDKSKRYTRQSSDLKGTNSPNDRKWL
jgi:hypothetical protein